MIPPSSNTGVKSPGEPGPYRTKVDALAFSAKAGRLDVLDLLGAFLQPSGTFAVHRRRGGWKGFEASADLLVEGASAGFVAWGGSAQQGTVYASLMGTGCALAGDLVPLVAHCEAQAWKLKRVDIAADVLDGSVTLDTVRQAHAAGKFGTGGRRPSMDYTGPIDGEERGGTVSIGARVSDKYARVYQKGFEVFGRMVGEAGRDWEKVLRAGLVDCDGVLVDPRDWVRVELELKDKTRPLPYDLVQRRDDYFAGAYPYFGEILPAAVPKQVMTPRQLGELSVQHALEHVRHQCGSMLYTLQAVHGGDAMAVWNQVVGSKHSESMLRAGVLLRDPS